MKLPNRAGDHPIRVEMEEGKRYAWCTCGLSEKQPFCDGKHRTTEFSPLIHIASNSNSAYFCTCKQTKNGPFCDGTHQSIDTP